MVQHLSLSTQPTFVPMAQTIVIGGGLAGLSAAHTVIERGGKVIRWRCVPTRRR
jgi:succinate dehydrogenase/fumarate reductase flavoprotein subunit